MLSSRCRWLLCLCLLLLSLLSLCSSVSGVSAPPVFEHKADRDVKGTKCEVCQAVVKQALRKIPLHPDLSSQKSRRDREQKVSDTLEGICAVDSFSRYEFSPPTMISACNDFLAHHGEEVESLLFKGVMTDSEMRTRVCVDTGLCKQLWTPEQEEQRRDRSPEESKREQEEHAAAHKKAEAEKKAAEKAKKKEAAAKKKAKAEAKKAEAEAKKAAKKAAKEAEAAAKPQPVADKEEL